MDGAYLIDVTVQFRLMGADFLILFECKRHSRPVGHEGVQVPPDKLRSTGAHKGVVVAASGFQRSASQYAQKHGIACVRWSMEPERRRRVTTSHRPAGLQPADTFVAYARSLSDPGYRNVLLTPAVVGTEYAFHRAWLTKFLGASIIAVRGSRRLMEMKTNHKRDLGRRAIYFTVVGIALRSVAYLSISLSFIAVAAPLAIDYNTGIAPRLKGPATFLALVLTWSLLCGGVRLNVIGRRHLSRVLHAPRELYDQPFVLYLRSFKDDSQLAKPEMTFLDATIPVNGHILFSSGLTAEEQIVQAFSSVGPVVAAGRPREKLPHVGAVRMYLPRESWQESVLDLMLRARLVVISVGLGRGGLLWELHQAVHNLPPHRLIILVLQSREQYGQFQKSVEEYFDSMAGNGNPTVRGCKINFGRLPDFPSSEKWEHLDQLHSWLITFNGDWVTEGTIVSASGLQRSRIRKAIREAVDPFLQRLI